MEWYTPDDNDAADSDHPLLGMDSAIKSHRKSGQLDETLDAQDHAH